MSLVDFGAINPNLTLVASLNTNPSELSDSRNESRIESIWIGSKQVNSGLGP